MVEANTAYPGGRNETEKHWQTMKLHGWCDQFPVDLLDEESPDLVLEIPEEENVGALFAGVEYQAIGRTTDKEIVKMKGFEKDLNEIVAEWEAPLEGVFPVKTADNAEDAKVCIAKCMKMYNDKFGSEN